MVKKIIHRYFKMFVVIVLSINIGSCDKTDDNICHRKELYFPDPYKDWFKRITARYYKTSSNTGLNEFLECQGRYVGYDYIRSKEECDGAYNGQLIEVTYRSDLYGHFIWVGIIQQKEGTIFQIYHVTGTGYYWSSQFILRYNLTLKEEQPVMIIKGSEDSTDYTVEVKLLDSLMVNGIKYKNVYRFTNTYNRDSISNNAELVDIYVDTDYGLIRYDQKDSTQWEIEY